MFKKIICVLTTLIILLSMFILPASADDTSASIKSWNIENWQSFFGADCDVTNLPGYETYVNDYFKTNGYVVNNSIILGSNFDGVNPGVLTLYVTDGEFNIKTGTLNSGNPCYDISGASNSTYIASLTIWKNSRDIHLSKSVSLGGKYTHLVTSDKNLYIDSKIIHFYYSANPYQSFLDYLNIGKADFNKIEPPEGFDKSAIKDSYCFDNPYNNYGFKPYKNDFENYLTSGLFSDLNIYYDSHFNLDSEHEHSETINFYVDMTSSDGNLVEDYHDHFSKHLLDYYLGVEIPEKELSSFINSHFRAVHFERDSYSVLDFFNPGYSDYDYSSFNEFISVEMIDSKCYLKFTLGSDYTFSGNIFLGHRITHTCSYINANTGAIGGSGNGLGSDMSQADDTVSRPPTKDELKDFGFDYGYPNTDGSFPYKLTIYRNSKEYALIYFNKMPSVASTWYSNKCIDYAVNVNDIKLYLYFKEQNMSKLIDFTTNEEDMYYSEGHVLQNPITDTVLKIFYKLLNVDTSEFSNTYTLHFWTNYSGSFDNMSGFYCKFNWNLEESGHFQKNNSDDDYDYSQDYSPEDSFTDNNGNIHGGAVDVITPTQGGDFNFNEEFEVNSESLTGMATNYLKLLTKIFAVFPDWVWSVLFLGFAIIVACRLLGR